MMNVERAREAIARVRAVGVLEFCVCAGSRNSPLLAVLGASDARLFSFVDERSAAFFALGRIKQHRQPVAVVTTSGTAVAELLPATVEAFYSDAPLILMTADRPARYRGTGAPQCIDQVGIFGAFAATDLDDWNAATPLHINLEFDEPLIDGEPTAHVILRRGDAEGPRVARLSHPEVLRRASPAQNDVIGRMGRPLLILAALASEDRDRAREFALALSTPVYAEALSGLREDPALEHLQIRSGERMIHAGDFDGVIRIGGVPALRFWRDLDESKRDLPVISYSGARFTGLSRGEVYPLAALPQPKASARDDAFFERDAAAAAKIAKILDAEPDSEPAIFRDLSRQLPSGSRIYLGNSLPIREWDLFAVRGARGFAYEGNRGANGIDGQLSTFFGWCANDRENVAIVGDLTALYDMNAPWIVPQLDPRTPFTIVIINNGGGKIFSRVGSLKAMDAGVRRRIVENQHSLRFQSWAAMWNLEERIIEKLPDADATRRVWEQYDALWS